MLFCKLPLDTDYSSRHFATDYSRSKNSFFTGSFFKAMTARAKEFLQSLKDSIPESTAPTPYWHLRETNFGNFERPFLQLPLKHCYCCNQTNCVSKVSQSTQTYTEIGTQTTQIDIFNEKETEMKKSRNIETQTDERVKERPNCSVNATKENYESRELRHSNKKTLHNHPSLRKKPTHIEISPEGSVDIIIGNNADMISDVALRELENLVFATHFKYQEKNLV